MNILMISGSLPPEPCGVGDFTYRLYQAILTDKYSIKLIQKFKWSYINAYRIYRAIRAEAPDLIHIQYPTAGYGYSLLPQIYAILFPSVVTIHEFSEVNILRKLSLSLFTVRSFLVFTNVHERDRFCQFYFWIKKEKTTVIPIGSSIDFKKDDSIGQIVNPRLVTYFGLIRPKKGVEELIELAGLIKEHAYPLKVRIVGKIVPNLIEYAKEMQAMTTHLPIEWCLNLPDHEVSDRLSESTYMYLPFPDGASMRRSSLFAALSHGIATITTKGTQTPLDMDDAVSYVKSPQEAFALIAEGQLSGAKLKHYQAKALEYVASFSWDSLSRQHIQLYEKLLNG